MDNKKCHNFAIVIWIAVSLITLRTICNENLYKCMNTIFFSSSQSDQRSLVVSRKKRNVYNIST